MSTNTFSPTVPQKAKDIMLGEGVVIYNYNEAGQAIMGATSGGSKLTLERMIKDVNYDGAMGPTKGMRQYEKFIASLDINFLKLNYVNLAYGCNVSVADGTDALGTYKKISFGTSFSATDVAKNITFKGYKANGEYCIIIIENAFNMKDIELEFNGEDAVVSELNYTGFYTYALPTTPPFKIQEEISA